MFCSFGDVVGTCGVGVLYNYSSEALYSSSTLVSKCESGTGFFIASFVVNESDSDAMYEHLCETMTKVYQSPVRINTNSNNPFYFCIFDKGGEDVL